MPFVAFDDAERLQRVQRSEEGCSEGRQGLPRHGVDRGAQEGLQERRGGGNVGEIDPSLRGDHGLRTRTDTQLENLISR